MGLKYKIGNLITAAQVGEVYNIAHQCNLYCTMGSGIAPLIKRAFPSAWEADYGTESGDIRKFGKYTLGRVGAVAIYNLYGQADWRGRLQGNRCTNYAALGSALFLMAKSCASNGASVGLPLLGAGLGGGDWDIIELLIEDAFSFFDLDVTIYVLDQEALDDINRKEG